ncbi:MAG: hypothetical protein ACXV3D_07820, partial [Halobacteriota archaeon]
MLALRRHGYVACVVVALALLVSPGMAAAQSPPSHTQVNTSSSGGFQFPDQLPLFEQFALYSNGVISNVSKSNFTGADAQLAAYSNVVDSVNASAASDQQSATVDAIKASRDDFSSFIIAAKRYNELYTQEQVLVKADPHSTTAVANALEMKALSAHIHDLQNTIEGRNGDIYGVAVDNGLNVAKYGNSNATLAAYSSQVDSRLANVTAQVFRDADLTLTPNTTVARYGSVLLFTGHLSDGQTGIANSSVDLNLDNATVATVRTDATGSYAYRFTVRDVENGSHVAVAKYAPSDAPYNPTQSGGRTLSIDQSPVNNTVSALSSVALGRNLAVEGTLMTANGPVVNSTVSLYLGDRNIAQTQTDQNGSYAFSASTTPYYFPAAVNGATIYTVFEPHGEPLRSATSAVTHVPVDLMGAYAGIAAVTGVVLLGVMMYTRRREAAIPPVVPEVPMPAEGPPIPTSVTPPPARVLEAPLQRTDVSARIATARAAFSKGNDQQAMD